MNKTKSTRTVSAAPILAKKRALAATATPVMPKAAAAAVKRSPHSAPAAPPKVKHKLVRDSFTIPKSEYVVLADLKVRAANLTRPIKKGELLRAGIAALHAMTDKAFLAALNAVPSLKTGRPKASGAVAPPAKGSEAR